MDVAPSPAEVRQGIAEVLEDAGIWMATPNELFYGSTPNEVVEKGEGQRVLDLIAAIKHGLPY